MFPLTSSNPEEQNQGDNLHVSGLSRNMTEKQLTELFNQYAKVYKAEIMYDPHTRMCSLRLSFLARHVYTSRRWLPPLIMTLADPYRRVAWLWFRQDGHCRGRSYRH